MASESPSPWWRTQQTRFRPFLDSTTQLRAILASFLVVYEFSLYTAMRAVYPSQALAYFLSLACLNLLILAGVAPRLLAVAALGLASARAQAIKPFLGLSECTALTASLWLALLPRGGEWSRSSCRDNLVCLEHLAIAGSAGFLLATIRWWEPGYSHDLSLLLSLAPLLWISCMLFRTKTAAIAHTVVQLMLMGRVVSAVNDWVTIGLLLAPGMVLCWNSRARWALGPQRITAATVLGVAHTAALAACLIGDLAHPNTAHRTQVVLARFLPAPPRPQNTPHWGSATPEAPTRLTDWQARFASYWSPTPWRQLSKAQRRELEHLMESRGDGLLCGNPESKRLVFNRERRQLRCSEASNGQ